MKAGGGEINRWRGSVRLEGGAKNGICLRSENAADAPVVDLTYRTRAGPSSRPHRTVGSNANAVTEPGWQKVQFWCSVIHPHIRGTVTRTHAADCDQYRDGVQLLADKRNEDGEWAELRFNLPG